MGERSLLKSLGLRVALFVALVRYEDYLAKVRVKSSCARDRSNQSARDCHISLNEKMRAARRA